MNDRFLHILSGLPGSGKSRWVSTTLPNARVCSADHFFVQKDGSYQYDSKLQPLAHQTCWRDFLAYAQAEVPLIVVDNTNLTVAEIGAYYLPGEAMGYQVLIHRWVTDQWLDCQRRNQHGVPLATFLAMKQRFLEDVLPPFWKVQYHLVGW